MYILCLIVRYRIWYSHHAIESERDARKESFWVNDWMATRRRKGNHESSIVLRSSAAYFDTLNLVSFSYFNFNQTMLIRYLSNGSFCMLQRKSIPNNGRFGCIRGLCSRRLWIYQCGRLLVGKVKRVQRRIGGRSETFSARYEIVGWLCKYKQWYYRLMISDICFLLQIMAMIFDYILYCCLCLFCLT